MKHTVEMSDFTTSEYWWKATGGLHHPKHQPKPVNYSMMTPSDFHILSQSYYNFIGARLQQR